MSVQNGRKMRREFGFEDGMQNSYSNTLKSRSHALLTLLRHLIASFIESLLGLVPLIQYFTESGSLNTWKIDMKYIFSVCFIWFFFSIFFKNFEKENRQFFNNSNILYYSKLHSIHLQFNESVYWKYWKLVFVRKFETLCSIS